MQSLDDINQLQDTSTQALTEVALGLSMAFFALLIIALFSMTLPSQVSDELKKGHENTPLYKQDFSYEVLIAANANKQNTDKQGAEKRSGSTGNTGNTLSTGNKAQAPFIVLYWGGKYFDTNNRVLSIIDVQSRQNVIVAVDPQIPFEQLIDIQKAFAGKEMRLTRLSPDWIMSLGAK
jgi:hypothetical protein